MDSAAPKQGLLAFLQATAAAAGTTAATARAAGDERCRATAAAARLWAEGLVFDSHCHLQLEGGLLRRRPRCHSAPHVVCCPYMDYA
jgi:hypothetical protein